VEEIGVMSGLVRISEALTRVSWVVVTCLRTEGSRVTKEKIINMGIRTAKAERRGIPQSLW